MYDVEKIRADFPMLQNKTMSGKPLVYLDNGATTFKPQCVIDAVTDYYCNYTANTHRGDYELSLKADEAYENARQTMADFINADVKEVVFTSGASGGLNLVAYGYGLKFLKKGDVILTTEAEHASNILPWYRVSELTGCSIEYIPLDDQGRITIENFQKAMHKEVKLVATASCGNVLGYKAPIKQMTKIAHEYGAVMVVDGAQSVPHSVTDVKDLDCDFLAFSSHKMCGPTGAGVLFGKYDLLDKMDSLMLGGGSNARFDMCGNILLKNPPHKFEAGTPPIEAIIGMAAAAKYLTSIGMENIEAHEQKLHKYLIEKITKLENVKVYNPEGDTGITVFNVKDVFPQDCASYLSSKGVAVRSGHHCAKNLVNFLQTPGTVRASVYLYNTESDVDALIEGLKTTTVENCIGMLF